MDFKIIDPIDASLPSTGNRFDVPGGGVLYCCSQLGGCYRETLARFRPDPTLAHLDEGTPNHFMAAGMVPASWRDARRTYTLSLEDAAPFVDVEHEETRALLDQVLDGRIADSLDVSDVRGRDRLLTRAIAEWVYTQVDEDDDGAYSGVRYMSRHGDFECWAVFDGTPIDDVRPPQAIEANDPVLQEVARLFGLTIC